MSLLGKYDKQPAEVEVYSIQFVEDMASTDEITSAWTMFSRISAAPWDQVVVTAPYTTVASDAERIIAATASITLMANAPDGYRVYVANQSQNSSITVGGNTVAARCSIIMARVSGAWVIEAQTTSVLVDAIGDQRVRTFVSGGVLGVKYKAQVTVTTSEGRTLQDEFTIRVREE